MVTSYTHVIACQENSTSARSSVPVTRPNHRYATSPPTAAPYQAAGATGRVGRPAPSRADAGKERGLGVAIIPTQLDMERERFAKENPVSTINVTARRKSAP